MNEYEKLNFPFHLQSPSPGSHNLTRGIPQLQETALRKQREAAEAWGELLHAHEASGSPWSAVLHTALAAGVRTDELRAALAAPPSTYSRWLGGLSQPNSMLRKRLASEVFAAVERTKATLAELLDRICAVVPTA